MATLVANNAESAIGRLALRPGINTLGRSEGNHHVIPHSSVSSRHCEVVVHDTSVSVRDLGSTNGTFIDEQQVTQGVLTHGQRLKVGSVEFVLDAPELVAAKAGPLRVSVPRASAVAAAEPAHAGRTVSEAIAALSATIDDEPKFYRQLPRAFAYPFNKSGMFLLLLGTGFFLLLSYAMRFALLFRMTIRVFTFGYLFAYMQRIISSSAQGEEEVPDFPEISEFWSDIILPFLLFAGTFVVSFAPAIVVAIVMRESEAVLPVTIATGAVCGFYFPMALLAVAVTDSFLALSPHVVVPSIARIFVPYLATCGVLGVLVAARFGVAYGLSFLPIPVLPTLIDGFVSLYLLMVEMRILGLLFRSYRSRLGWL